MSSTDVIIVTTVVAVDRPAAFDVFTKEIDAWWKRGPRFRFVPDREGVLRFEPGEGGRLVEAYGDGAGDVYEVGRVLAWEPPGRLVFECRARGFQPDERTEVEVRFEEVEQGTRVTIEHRGWDRFPADHPVKRGFEGRAFTDLMAVWWGEQLVALGARLRDERP